jgi:hypothetical protein
MRNTQTTSHTDMFMDKHEMEKILVKLNLPQELRETILTELPPLFERLDDMAKKAYDPTQVWLESIQFADYVTQIGEHIQSCDSEICIDEVSEQLINMSNSFKQMGENALTLLDEMEKESDGEQ